MQAEAEDKSNPEPEEPAREIPSPNEGVVHVDRAGLAAHHPRWKF